MLLNRLILNTILPEHVVIYTIDTGELEKKIGEINYQL